MDELLNDDVIPRRTNELIVDWFRRSRESQQIHYACANFFGRMHYWLGIPAVVLATTVGTAVFASLEKELDGYWKIVVGTVSIAAAVLASLQTFLGLSERAEAHRSIAAQYAAVRRDIEMLKTFFEQEPEPKERLAKIKETMDTLAKTAPDVPARIKATVGKQLKRKGHNRIFVLPPEKA